MNREEEHKGKERERRLDGKKGRRQRNMKRREEINTEEDRGIDGDLVEEKEEYSNIMIEGRAKRRKGEL